MATIGCDPEIILVTRRSGERMVVAAQEYFGSVNGTPSVTPDVGSIGRDGSHILAELRPSPSTKASDITRRLAILLTDLSTVVGPRVEMEIGSWDTTTQGVGGHLHAWGRTNTQQKLRNDAEVQKICVGVSLLWGLESRRNGTRRRMGRYGHLMDMRWSTPAREFRSPSADWMAHPTLARHTLSFFLTLVEQSDRYLRDLDERIHLIQRGDKFWNESTSEATQDKYLQDILNAVKGVMSAKTLSTLEFFRTKLDKMRDERGLIRLDVEKWRTRACAE